MKNIPWKTVGIIAAVAVVLFLAYQKVKSMKPEDSGEPAKKEG